jgi:hypothetical protein
MPLKVVRTNRNDEVVARAVNGDDCGYQCRL